MVGKNDITIDEQMQLVHFGHRPVCIYVLQDDVVFYYFVNF